MNPYEWHEVSPGHFERNADGLEAATIFINASMPAIRERFAILAGTTFSHDFVDVEPRLKNAWLSMRFHHPSLVVTVEVKKLIYRIPSKLELSEWLSRTFIITKRLPDCELPPIGNGREAMLYFMPETNEVLLHCPHDRLDGYGALHLLNNIFKAVIKPTVVDFGGETRNLSPSLRIAAKSHAVTPAQMSDVFKIFKANWDSRGSSGLVPVSSRASGKLRRTFATFSLEDTLSIVHSTRRLGFTVTQAIHAALIIASSTLGKGNCIYGTAVAQNLRPNLHSPFNNAGDHPAACYFYPNPFTIQASTDFNSVATQIRSAYKEKAMDRDVVYKALALGENLPDILQTVATKSTIQYSTPSLSSMGIIDEIFNAEDSAVAIQSPWLTTDDVSADISGHLWTWHRQMTINLSYNEACFSKQQMRKLLQTSINILATNLHLELHPSFNGLQL